MCLELAKLLPERDVALLVHLFPTVQHIGSTPNGVRLFPVLKTMRDAAHGWISFLADLGDWAKDLALRVGADGMSASARRAGRNIASGDVCRSCLHMAYHEMREILDLDPAHALAVADKCVFYLGVDDGWNRISEAAELRKLFPSAQVLVDSHGHKHAFVVDDAASASVAEKTWAWVAARLDAAEPVRE
jgi:hypothetical protein